MKKYFTLLAAAAFCTALMTPEQLSAQDTDKDQSAAKEHTCNGEGCCSKNMMMPKGKRPQNTVYLSSNMEGYLLTTALVDNGTSSKLTTPRFTAFFHLGANLNYDFSKSFGIYTGVNVKNIGYITKAGDMTTKRRVYTAGIPVGLKIGNVHRGTHLLVGGGVDFPLNYKEKTFVKRGDKEKFNEWFSDRTPAVMPYAFVGVSLHPGLALKLQYYPTNFMNQEYAQEIEGGLVRPYANEKVNLMMLTIGYNISYFPKD